MRLRPSLIGFVVLTLGMSVLAQAPPSQPAFEVASVQVWKAGVALAEPPGPIQFGRNSISVGPVPLGYLLGIAFDVSGSDQMSGLPDWSRTEQYTVSAKAEDGVVLTRENVRPRLQRLLADRFKLAAHSETAEANGYGLVVAKGGPKLTPTTAPLALVSLGNDRIRAPSVDMKTFAGGLAMLLQAPVADETHLAGNYALTMTFAPIAATDSPLPSIFTRLQEQLGLKLETGRKVPVQRLVIDHVDHPTED